ITSKILSEDTMADTASPRLSSIRKHIRELNVRIRDKLNSYIRGQNKFLQDNVVTMRMNRYVIPVKSEYKGMVKGFVHDQSSTGSTVFIEPEQVVEYNNELKTAEIEEKNEIYRILQELSVKVAGISKSLKWNNELLVDIDVAYAKASYAFETRSSKPVVNTVGKVNIKRGRHPLINPEKVIPVTVRLGDGYNFLLVTGPNTGGKTVTMKLVGLFTVMAMSGLYVPCDDESDISVFNDIFCDIGDEQSIEQSLSTFSSHMLNIIGFCNNLSPKSLVLLDELGAGTDPEEGSALALSIIETLLDSGSFGIITTHYSRLKEYAMGEPRIENASMDFDTKTLRPVYKLNIGIPGSSNAIEISRRLGLNEKIASRATELLSDNKISFENILKKAEETRQNAEKLSDELELLRAERIKEINEIKAEKEAVKTEKEKITAAAKQEVKRIVSERLIEAEAIVDELNEIFRVAELENGDLIKARTLRNRLADSKYLEGELPLTPYELHAVDVQKLAVGDMVYVKSLNEEAVVNDVNLKKGKVEVLLGNMKVIVKIDDIFNQNKVKQAEKPQVKRLVERQSPKTEINILGKTVQEGIEEVEKFIDQAIVNNISEIRIVHGTGTGKLRKGIREYLKTNKRVAEYRQGTYGEGESGVTVVTLK
ncbi:MAG: endonuclease MutS2, partial [Clostridia bacterium]|nr:endonuclease MutS2 [Clostridia bacterium]